MPIHLVGIGGAGLSAIARVLLERGFAVSGSDQRENEYTAELRKAGAAVAIGHDPEHVRGAELVLISSAVPPNNPEVVAAQEAGIPVVKRAAMLGALMTDSVGIAVAGSHGKTTTTGMVAQILVEAQLDPSVIVGGNLPRLGTNGRAGSGPHFVVEADEYDRMFLGLRPQMAVITNLEYDHPDLYPTPEAYEEAFAEFVRLLPEDGLLVIGADDQHLVGWAHDLEKPVKRIVTYGVEHGRWRGVDLRPNQLGGTDFVVQREDETVGLARLRVPGRHNVSNALAAIVLATEIEIAFSTIRSALADFGGIGRRFQVLGEIGDVAVIDDYAHHPTEIRATLAAARQRYPGRRLWAVWQPHTFTRTRRLLEDFATSFTDADRVITVDIFRSRETDSLGISGAAVAAALEHDDAQYAGDLAEAAQFILERLKPGDVVLTLSAGDANRVGYNVLAGLEARLTARNSNNNSESTAKAAEAPRQGGWQSGQ